MKNIFVFILCCISISYTHNLNNCTVVDLTEIGCFTTIIQPVGINEENRKLDIAFEAKVGDGNLLVLYTDLYRDIDSRPATQQLIYSFKNYVSSDSFVPAVEVPALYV